jgi:molybdopterin synthase catalytic subunit
VKSWITRDPIDVASLLPLVGASDDGAVLVFVGIVRDQNDGERVAGMQYDAFVEMAERVLSDIVIEATARLGTDHVVVVHRIGELRIGDASVAILVSIPHRAQAYDASRYIIEEIKKRLPVWKQEHYAVGTARWLDGHVPQAERAQ